MSTTIDAPPRSSYWTVNPSTDEVVHRRDAWTDEQADAALDRAEQDRAIVILTGQPGILSGGYDLKVKEIAHNCGFVDSNYFCRLFRKNTERSPSEYRRQYHSQLTEKPR